MKRKILILILLCPTFAFARDFKKEFNCYESLRLPGEPVSHGPVKAVRDGESAYYLFSPKVLFYCPGHTAEDCIDLPRQAREKALRGVLTHRLEAYHQFCTSHSNCEKSLPTQLRSCRHITLIARDVNRLTSSTNTREPASE